MVNLKNYLQKIKTSIFSVSVDPLKKVGRWLAAKYQSLKEKLKNRSYPTNSGENPEDIEIKPKVDMSEQDKDKQSDSSAVYPEKPSDRPSSGPAPKSGIVWWQVILLILIAVSISSNYYLLNWAKEKNQEQADRIEDLKKTINELKEINISAKIEEILKNVQQQNVRENDEKKEKVIAELTGKIEQFINDTDLKISRVTEGRMDKDVQEKLSEFTKRLEADKADIRRQLSKINTDLNLEKRLSSIERKLNNLSPNSRENNYGYQSRTSVPRDATVLKPQKIYVRDPMQLFSGQVQITLLSADFNSAKFSLEISDYRPQMVPMVIGERRIFDFQGDIYFLALHFANSEWAEISVTRKL